MASAIEFDSISKQYRLGQVGRGTLSADLSRWWAMNVLRKEDPYLKIGETNDRAIVHMQHSDEIHGLPLLLSSEGAFGMVSTQENVEG